MADRGVLVDAHALIWWWDHDARLSPEARRTLTARHTRVFVSAAVAWELATKHRVGKLPQMDGRIDSYVSDVLDDGFEHLAVETRHGLYAGMLPGSHRDPFDRIQASQALIEGLTIVSRDPAFAAFGCEVLW